MMDAKRALTNGVFCPMPWTGLMYNFDGTVKNCIRSAGTIGNIRNDSIHDILRSRANQVTQEKMLHDQPGPDCHTCYDLERGKKSFDIISDRIFYLREMKAVSFDVYKQGNHQLKTVDVRWSNLCNFACVYCGPYFSSRWASELDMQIQQPTDQQIEDFKNYILSRAADFQHVYMAGGEPLLMKQNLELLEKLKKVNPHVNLRVNTNLSKVDTQVFQSLCEFNNVHWIISVESVGQQFEYIRTGANWQDFNSNLLKIKNLNHKISFNMLYFLLNHRGLFDCVDYLRDLGFHPNAFVIGALLTPDYLNIRHLPQNVLESIQQLLTERIAQAPGYLLEDGYQNLLHYVQQPFEKNLAGSIDQIKVMDRRRGLDSSSIFLDLYQLI